MGGFFKELWPFGGKKKPEPKVEPVTPPGTIPSRPAGPSIPQPGSGPAPTTGPGSVTPITPPTGTATLLDRLTVDGEVVDSHVIEATGILVRTELRPLSMARGKTGTLTLVVEAEPLADPADRKALHDALHLTGDPMKIAGAHELIVTAMPIRNSNILMSAPKSVANPEAVFRVETKDPNYMHFKLFFWGDDPMRMEIKIPFNIAASSPIEDPFDYFDIKWMHRRGPGMAGQLQEFARKIVVVAE